MRRRGIGGMRARGREGDALRTTSLAFDAVRSPQCAVPSPAHAVLSTQFAVRGTTSRAISPLGGIARGRAGARKEVLRTESW